MYFPIRNVPEMFDKCIPKFIDVCGEGFVPEFIDVYTDIYIPDFLYIPEFLIVENGPVWS